MKTEIKLNKTTAVDVQKFMDGKLLLQANTGGGKSWAIRRILEQLFNVVPIIVLDTEGEFSTLRQHYDFILIGKGQEITADHKSAALLAHRLIKERVSAVIDLFEMKPMERQLFVKNFVQAMTDAPKDLWLPTLLVIDEAQTYAPESDKSETGSVLHDAAFKFRKRHYGIIFATPRIAVLSKNISSTCRNKLIGYTSEPNDVKRAAYELGFSNKDAIESLRQLEPGEFFVFGQAISKDVVKIKIGDVVTAHGSEKSVRAQVAKPSAKIKRALAALADLPKAAAEEVKTIEGLKGVIAVQKREIGELRRAPAAPVDPQAIESARAAGYAEATKTHIEFRKKIYQRLLKTHGHIFDFQKTLGEIVDELRVDGKFLVVPPHLSAGVINTRNIDKVMKDIKEKIPTIAPNAPSFLVIPKDEESSINKGELTILQAIAGDHDGITTEHIAVLTGYRGTSRREYLRKLVAKGYVERKGEIFIATQDGIAVLGDNYKPLPTGYELKDYWLNNLPDGERKIFTHISNSGYATKEQIQEATNYKGTSVREYLRKLRARKLIEDNADGTVRLSNTLS